MKWKLCNMGQISFKNMHGCLGSLKPRNSETKIPRNQETKKQETKRTKNEKPKPRNLNLFDFK